MLLLHFHPRTLSSSVFVVFNQSSQAKVGDFADQIVSHKDVSSPQVSVDVVHPLDEGHAICNLDKMTGNQVFRNSYKSQLVISSHGSPILGGVETLGLDEVAHDGSFSA